MERERKGEEEIERDGKRKREQIKGCKKLLLVLIFIKMHSVAHISSHPPRPYCSYRLDIHLRPTRKKHSDK